MLLVVALARAAAGAGRHRRSRAPAGSRRRGAAGRGECRDSSGCPGGSCGAAEPRSGRQPAGLGAARALRLPRRRGARGGLRHDRDRAPPGRPGRDISAAAGARLGRLRACRHARRRRRSTGLLLARPLLGVSRARSREIAAASGLPIVADPSNADPRFDRVRMRALMPALAEHGLDACAAGGNGGRLGRAAAALDHYAGGVAAGAFQRRSLRRRQRPCRCARRRRRRRWRCGRWRCILRAVGGADYTPRARQRSRRCATRSLHRRAATRLKRTLSGVVVARSGRTPHGAPRMGPRRPCRRCRRRPARRSSGTGASASTVPMPGRRASASGRSGRSERRCDRRGRPRRRCRRFRACIRTGRWSRFPTASARRRGAGPLDILAAECIVGQRLGLAAGGPAGPA